MRILVVFCLVASLALGASLPTAAPEQAGFSSDRLNRINTVMQEHIDSGASERRFRPHRAQRQGRLPGDLGFDYKPDTIVRMYSMTKAITGVAAMILYEEGKFSLTDPVSKYLPEFTKMSVAQESFDAAGHRTYYTVPADRPITVRDLFRHTSGLDYDGPKDENGEPAYKKLGVTGGNGWVPFDLGKRYGVWLPPL
jgi:CubicO group peptidase (beta-lactamase class C family)